MNKKTKIILIIVVVVISVVVLGVISGIGGYIYTKRSKAIECQNGGIYDEASKSCICPGGFGGVDCSEQVCGLQCQNGGTLDSTTCSCSCPQGFMGADCSEIECNCINGARDTSNPNACACVCNLGFTGQYCEMQGDPLFERTQQKRYTIPSGGYTNTITMNKSGVYNCEQECINDPQCAGYSNNATKCELYGEGLKYRAGSQTAWNSGKIYRAGPGYPLIEMIPGYKAAGNFIKNINISENPYETCRNNCMYNTDCRVFSYSDKLCRLHGKDGEPKEGYPEWTAVRMTKQGDEGYPQ